MEYLIGAVVCLLMIYTSELLPFFVISVVMSIVFTSMLNKFYEENGYYRGYSFWLRRIVWALSIGSVILAVCGFLLGSGGGSVGAGILALSIWTVVLIIGYIREVRKATKGHEEAEAEWNTIKPMLVEAIEVYSRYAYIVSFFVKADNECGTYKSYIKVRVVAPPDYEASIDNVCCGSNSTLALFADYAKEHCPGKLEIDMARSTEGMWITFTFPDNSL